MSHLLSKSNLQIVCQADVLRCKLDWDTIDRSISSVDSKRGVVLGSANAGNTLPDDYAKQVDGAFKNITAAFDNAFKTLGGQIRLIHWIIFPALGIAVALGVVGIYFEQWVIGSTVSGVSLTSLFLLIGQSWDLGRRQGMLGLIPRIYETMFAIARTPEQHDQAFQAYKEEIATIRRMQWGAMSKKRGLTPRGEQSVDPG
jgi:hypothetical protein